MRETIRIRGEALTRLLDEARREREQECCGLLAGCDGVMTRIFPAMNSLRSATAYEIAPAELFRLLREIRRSGLELMGIYHSHPAGENSPSPRDIERAYYPGAAYFILSPLPDAPKPVRAFFIRQGHAAEAAIKTV